MRSIILISFLSISGFGISQQRIGMDVNSRLSDLNFTAHYTRVVKGPFLASAGIFFGSNGNATISNATVFLERGYSVTSPYSPANESLTIDNSEYKLLEYTTRGRSVGVQLGIGYYKEFNTTHGLRLNLNQRFGYATSHFSGRYYSTDLEDLVPKQITFNHVIGATSVELYHTYRYSGKWTLYWGVKIPYYYTLDKNTFNPTSRNDLFSGLEADLSLGVTRVIGKCD